MGLWVRKMSRFAWQQAPTNCKPDVLRFLSDSKTQSLAFGFRHPASRQAAERLAEVIRVCGMHSRKYGRPKHGYVYSQPQIAELQLHISTRSGSISYKYLLIRTSTLDPKKEKRLLSGSVIFTHVTQKLADVRILLWVVFVLVRCTSCVIP